MEEHLRLHGKTSGLILSHEILPDVQVSQGRPGQEFPIAPISCLSQAAITTVYTLPASVDVERLKGAISHVIGVWRITCGRLGARKTQANTEYYFTLTDSTITLDVQTFDHSDQAPSLPDKTVLQPLSILNPFLTLLPPSFPTPNSDTTLLSFRLTLLPERSVLGIQFSHIMGDGAAFLRFITHLSNAYAEPTYRIPVEEYPNFGAHVGPLPTLDAATLARLTNPTMPKVDVADAMKVYVNAATNYEPFCFKISQDEVQELRQIIAGAGSDQDAISALYILLLRRLGHPVEHLMYMINYRSFHTSHPAFPTGLALLSANVSQLYTIDLDPSSDLRATSLQIRKSLQHLRASPEETLEWVSACSTYGGVVDPDKMAVMIPPPGWAAVNSSFRFDFNVHFGFNSDQTTYHTSWSGPAFLRIFRSNPPCTPGEAELTFAIEKGRLQEAQETLRALKAELGLKAAL